MTRLFVNGCSYTYGHGLDNPQEECWGSVLAKRNNWDLTNLAVPGSCNERIFLRTLSCTDLHDCKLIIGWSHLTRFSLYRPNMGMGDDFSVIFPNHMKDGTDEQKEMALAKQVIHDEITAKLFLMQSIVMLQSWLKDRNVDYYFFFGGVKCFSPRSHKQDDCPLFAPLIEQIEWDRFFYNTAFMDHFYHLGMCPPETGIHPNKEANEIWTDILIERFDLHEKDDIL